MTTHGSWQRHDNDTTTVTVTIPPLQCIHTTLLHCCNLYHLRLRVLVLVQLEQPLRILPSYLETVSRVHLRIVEPDATIFKRLEWIVDREQNTIRANLVFHKVQSCR